MLSQEGRQLCLFTIRLPGVMELSALLLALQLIGSPGPTKRVALPQIPVSHEILDTFRKLSDRFNASMLQNTTV